MRPRTGLGRQSRWLILWSRAGRRRPARTWGRAPPARGASCRNHGIDSRPGCPAERAGLRRPVGQSKRLIAIANVNNDISEYWEFSDTGLFVVDLSNEAYKFGVNYIIYGMTH